MKLVYEAANSIEAHVVLGLLEQARLSGHIDGEHLQGGIGELQAIGGVRVMVHDHDYPAAKQLVEEWDKSQPKDPGSEQGTDMKVSPMKFLVIGFLLGSFVTSLFFAR